MSIKPHAPSAHTLEKTTATATATATATTTTTTKTSPHRQPQPHSTYAQTHENLQKIIPAKDLDSMF